MIKYYIAVACLFFSSITGNLASANEPELAYFITPYIGYTWYDDEQNVDDNPAYGVRIGYNFTKYFGMETSLEYTDTNYDNDNDSRSVNIGNYRLDAIFNLLPDNQLVPFVFAGVGGQYIDYPRGIDDRNAATLNYGAGLKYFLDESVALRADIRQIHIFQNIDDLDDRRDIEATVGVTYYFGGPEAQPAPDPTPVSQATAAPMVAQQTAVAETQPEVVVLVFEDIHFDFDSSALKPEAKAILKRNIQLLKDNPRTHIRIAGYTSASGSAEYNKKLSERRANAVKNYLINEGIITEERLSMIGYGEMNPAKYEASPQDILSQAAKANMRVLFEIIVK
ncbi:OmpA-OmpF porin, OOP family [Desulfomicrobium norvegicum]|uniref:OmpA-OmpF porin, OOP family n=1 Tax=Desulfomicrobium norvegicum (strain DSM 1741 / NCIMB 8310) TaxID=52561 RepID=A0A8G2BZX7_DESNO|nr:OmpA family protein [Desulfomicrobium norvegicum]SFL29015.1 OmpA-OmpF porin, OOP family [Desulfomicrobium norvegicum]